MQPSWGSIREGPPIRMAQYQMLDIVPGLLVESRAGTQDDIWIVGMDKDKGNMDPIVRPIMCGNGNGFASRMLPILRLNLRTHGRVRRCAAETWGER